MAHERICIVDKAEYRYCGRCSKYPHREGGEMFCSDNCRNIFNACSKYVTKNINATEANELLEKLDLSNYDNFQDALKKNITDIRAEVEKEREKAIDIVDEPKQVEVVIEKPKPKKKLVNVD